MKERHIIAAIADNRAIGYKNELIYRIPDDLKRFKEITMGNVVIMGRKTYESIGRPLPKRTNVVITRGDVVFEGCAMAHSLEEAIAMADGDEEIFVIGGAQIYAEALKVADRLYITRVEHDYDGDTSFPEFDLSAWRLVAEERHERGEEYEYPFSFQTFDRV